MREINPKERDLGLRCIAQLMNIIRPDWEFNGCLAILRKLPTSKTLAEITRAATWFAEARTQQRTPAMLAEDGAHWRLDDERAPLPPKPQTLSEPKPPPLPPETIRAYRDRIRKETP